MHRKWFWIYAGLMITLAAPLPAQRGGGGAGSGGGLGLGRTAGGVAGTATGTVNSTVNGTTRGTVHEEGRTGANAGSTRGLGASGGALGVAQNAQLSSRLQTLLPASTTVPAAAAGFENQGQFIAAVHAAHNLNIPFDQLKAQMTGKNDLSLGQAIHNLKPDLDTKAIKENVKLADREAEHDLDQASSGNKTPKFVSRISSDQNLSARLTTLLPPGMTLANAAAGFKNEGQFIAALHVSKNLGISFAELKDRMTAGESLGASIHQLKPEFDTKASEAAAAEGEAEAREDRAGVSVAVSGTTQTTAK